MCCKCKIQWIFKPHLKKNVKYLTNKVYTDYIRQNDTILAILGSIYGSVFYVVLLTLHMDRSLVAQGIAVAELAASP